MPQKPSAELQKSQKAKQRRENVAEKRRLQKLNIHEIAAREAGYTIVAGVDEAGRGPLAGPVVAAACIIPHGIFFIGIDDSKKLLPQKRFKIFEQILSDERVSYGIGIASVEEIDQINILQATKVAMERAIANLKYTPDLLLIDGNQPPKVSISCKCIIGGDAQSQSIAAASILAKETRDGMMLKYHSEWPQYRFDQHKGYSTPEHLSALAQHGPCPLHRKSFEPVRLLLNTKDLIC